MATLTKSTGTVALTGAAEKVTLPASYGWVWVKNMSDADMFVGLSADISEGADGVMTIPAGECGRVQTDGFSSVYLLGTGNALIVAQNYADCPFKVGGKGGEIPDLSLYAKKTDIPTKLPANGGNADTVGGLKIIIDTITANSDAAGYVWLGNKKFISVMAQGYSYSGIFIDAASGSTNLYFPDNKSTTMTIRVVYLEEV